jgi:hypothetical protein
MVALPRTLRRRKHYSSFANNDIGRLSMPGRFC